jgi:hypothetical protein
VCVVVVVVVGGAGLGVVVDDGGDARPEPGEDPGLPRVAGLERHAVRLRHHPRRREPPRLQPLRRPRRERRRPHRDVRRHLPPPRQRAAAAHRDRDARVGGVGSLARGGGQGRGWAVNGTAPCAVWRGVCRLFGRSKSASNAAGVGTVARRMLALGCERYPFGMQGQPELPSLVSVAVP